MDWRREQRGVSRQVGHRNEFRGFGEIEERPRLDSFWIQCLEIVDPCPISTLVEYGIEKEIEIAKNKVV